MSSSEYVDSSFYLNAYEESEQSTDDLEKALVLAAADADARNNLINYEEQATPSEEETPNDPSVYCQPTSSTKNSLSETENDDEPQPKKLRCDPSVEKTVSEGYSQIIATHYNKLEEKGLDERSKSRIFYMRNFHNWIKSMLINEYLTKIKNSKKHNSPIRVLDMGCGKGGDLLKWRKGGISHLICSDIASVSLDQCKSRYSDMQNRRERGVSSNIYSIEYIAADSTKDRLREKYRDPSMKLDLVSCQFVFHYCFESLSQAECMLHNAGECLQPGGFFIGTIPDSNDLLARARKCNSQTFGNDVFEVNFETDIYKPPLFGAKYNFKLDGVVNCPEFLVHFPTLVKLAKKYGLKLVNKEKFNDFYEKMKWEGKNLMGNMRSLESYPPHSDCPLEGKAQDDYKHAEEYLKSIDNSTGRPLRLGTLSKSEWEVSSLYLTFAFQKVKNTWGTDGTPIYDI